MILEELWNWFHNFRGPIDYYEFSRENLFLKLIKEFWKRKSLSSNTWQHQSVPRGMLTSA
jgi:hypothetical protein